MIDNLNQNIKIKLNPQKNGQTSNWLHSRQRSSLRQASEKEPQVPPHQGKAQDRKHNKEHKSHQQQAHR